MVLRRGGGGSKCWCLRQLSFIVFGSVGNVGYPHLGPPCKGQVPVEELMRAESRPSLGRCRANRTPELWMLHHSLRATLVGTNIEGEPLRG